MDLSQASSKLDLSQAMQLLHWLDEERRKDKALAADLQKRLEEQKELLIGIGRRIEMLEGRLTTTQNASARVDQIENNLAQARSAQGRQIEAIETHLNTLQANQFRFDQIESNLQQTRAEANALVDKFEHRLRESLDQAAQARAIERERDNRAMAEVRAQLEQLVEMQRRLDAFASEDRRLSDQFAPMRLNIENLTTAIEEYKPRMQYLEEWGERLTRQISELKLIEARVKAEHAQMLETLRRQEENLRQQLSQFAGDLGEHRRQVDGALGGLPPLGELYEQARRVLAHYEGLDDELRAEQQKLAQLLTLSEERVKETLAEYRSDYEKNWEQHLTNFDLHRQQQREMAEAITARLDALEDDDAEHADRWHALRETWAEQSKRQLLELERARAELEATVSGKKRRRSAP